MANLNEPRTNTESDHDLTDEPETGIQKKMLHKRQWCVPRRYVIAVMMFVALIINDWRKTNCEFLVRNGIWLADGPRQQTMANWTVDDLKLLLQVSLIFGIFAQMPAALLIFRTSSHKFLSVSIACASIFHLLTPLALDHHSYAFVFVLIVQEVLTEPARIAVLCMWKDWAPPAERTRLLMFTFCGSYISSASFQLHLNALDYMTRRETIYIAGACSLIWSLLWYFMVYETPSNDPWISEREFLYLQNNIPFTVKQRSKLSGVQWKHIFTSKPIFAISVIYFKVACSIKILVFMPFYFHLDRLLYNLHNLYYEIPFAISCAVVILIATILVDILLRRFPEKNLIMRKSFICGAFAVHSILLFGTIWSSMTDKILFFCVSYAIFHVAVPGFITIALDLSPFFVPIIGGIIGTFHYLGSFLCATYMREAMKFGKPDFEYAIIFIFDAVLGLVAAIVFFMWGSAEEQAWSLNTSDTHRSTAVYRRCAEPENEDDLSRATDH